jgi:hypothetical protein
MIYVSEFINHLYYKPVARGNWTVLPDISLVVVQPGNSSLSCLFLQLTLPYQNSTHILPVCLPYADFPT